MKKTVLKNRILIIKKRGLLPTIEVRTVKNRSLLLKGGLFMTKFKNIYDEVGNDISTSNETSADNLYQQQYDKATELKKVRKKLKQLKSRADDKFCILTKKEKKKLKRYKREKYKLKKQLAVIEAKISSHDERIARTEDSISLIIPEVLHMRNFYRQQLIQKLSSCNNPQEIEGYLKLLEGGGVYGKKL